ncbi:hypothetical protein [Phaeobacter sp. 22II1-1F12B]|uniref:hypothetical protein n=1 Tax=Phaeobacter sp. 22II1-1F12B TaxID=1317111 RepID=UPI0011869115|nr:hypothetical protein [Phaeobacter sp. 22II1-1F12B]
MKSRHMFSLACLALLANAALASDNPDQSAIDACIDHLAASGLASGPGGTVLNSSFSQAGTEVMLEDGGGTVWRCIAYADGTIGVLEKATEEQASAARTAPQLSDFQEVVKFDAGRSGTTLTRRLEPGGAFQFILGAGEGQQLEVSITPQSGEMYYTIRNPDGSILQEGTDASTDYSGKLQQSGDHVVEVVNETAEELTYDISFEIE